MADDRPALTGLTPDFTIPREPKIFILGGATYHAPGILSPITLKRVGSIAAKLGGGFDVGDMTEERLIELVTAVADALGHLVGGAHGKEIRERVLSEGDDAIDLMREALPAFTWLMEAYGMRPTRPSSPSSSGSMDGSDDTPSGVGASPTASESAS